MIVEAGAQVLVVHGRLREMKGHLTGVADWEKIRKVQEAVGHLVPVIANGNILYHDDVDRCLEETGCVGVMSAEGNLYNPAIFTRHHPKTWELAEEYLAICDEQNTKISYTRGHLFKIFQPCLSIHTDLRTELALTESREAMWEVTRKMKERLINDEKESLEKGESFEGRVNDKGFPILPHWIAQPYFRQPMPDQSKKVEGDTDAVTTGVKRPAGETTGQGEECKVKKIKPKKTKVQANLCKSGQCLNTFSPKCVHQRCKACCRLHQHETSVFDCEPHAIRSITQEQLKGDNGVQEKPTVDAPVAVLATTSITANSDEKSA
jgi:tRNA-dihydrouridine synthase 1